MKHVLKETNLTIPGLILLRRGKSKDIYKYKDQCILVFTDRVSIFDTHLPYQLIYKGLVNANISKVFIQDLFRGSWFFDQVHPNILIGQYVKPIQLEVIVRRYLTGSLFKRYVFGSKPFLIDSLSLNGGLHEYYRFNDDVIEFTTKSVGKDRFISEKDVIDTGLLSVDEIGPLKMHAKQVFTKCFAQAYENGLLLANMKLEFGRDDDNVIKLIDGLCDPDSALLIDLASFQTNVAQFQPQISYSKDVIRSWYEKEQISRQELHTLTPNTEDIHVFAQLYIDALRKITGGDIPDFSDLKDIYSKIFMEHCIESRLFN